MLAVTLGSSYTGVARYPEALELLSTAVSDLEASAGANDPRTLLAMQRWALALADSGDTARAIEVARETLARAHGTLADGDEIVIDVKTLLCSCLRATGQHDEALALGEEAVAAGLASLGESSRPTLSAMYNFAQALQVSRRYDESACWLERVLRVRREHYGDEDLESLQALSELGCVESLAGRVERAIELGRESAWRWERAFGLDNGQNWITLHNTAGSLQKNGEYAEAERWQRLALSSALRTVGREEVWCQEMLQQLGGILFWSGKLDEGIAVLFENVDALTRLVGPADDRTVKGSSLLARMLGHAGRYDEALQHVQERIDAIEADGADPYALARLRAELEWLERR
jgi:tetratricopeptide (TPR) repeat protein